MPTIAVNKKQFLADIGSPNATTDEFDELCFEYGLELDEDTSIKEPDELPHKLKIEVPANRYDLLCHEGLARALRIFLEREQIPKWNVVPPATGAEERWVEIQKETAQIRPYFASAILRGVNFTPESYASFIDLQDKLHQNLARKRTLVAIGTHDLDRVAKGKITYEARPPKDIKFAPLNKDTEYTAEQLMELYESDKHLSRYLHIIKDSPVYPIIYDSTQQVLSMPPIINSQHTKITLDTKNIFIDMTATDQTKLQIVTNIMVTMFAQYTSVPFTIEQVKIVYPDGRTVTTPDLSPTVFTAHQSYINSCTGLALSQAEIIHYLNKMGNDASSVPSSTDPSVPSDKITVSVPASRPDILHECDIMEEVAIAYGFNKLKKTFPATNTVAVPLPVNKLSDIVRRECSLAGFIEVLPLILCSHDENFAWLNRKDDGKTAVVLENPKTAEYQIVRTSLLPGLLKSIRENRKHTLPMKIFEVSDVVVKDDKAERKARNIRKVAALYCGKKAGFEVVHGLLDRVMAMLDIENLKNNAGKSDSGKAGYYIEQHDDATFFPDRAAKIYYRPAGAKAAAHGQRPSLEKKAESALDTIKDKLMSALPSAVSPSSSSSSSAAAAVSGGIEIGTMGIVHPTVLQNFDLEYPCSVLEFTLEGL
uniref:phenylalanine--tRNA ligase n=1 Tax=Hordeum vulgare subsp. vulgare TaxID=112509 RepID=F2DXX2_HORVV|nr:predicted protein [Hordeum vulgare subsp. vulgare]